MQQTVWDAINQQSLQTDFKHHQLWHMHLGLPKSDIFLEHQLNSKDIFDLPDKMTSAKAFNTKNLAKTKDKRNVPTSIHKDCFKALDIIYVSAFWHWAKW